MALWICALNPLVIIHLMGGVHNEMLMVGLMMAGIALTLARHPVPGVTLVAVGVAVKATAGLALPFLVWVWMRQLRDPQRRGMSAFPAFMAAGAASVALFVATFAVLSWLAGVGLGWLTALAGSVKIINWLTIPTAVANITNSVGGLFFPVNFYAVLDITRLIGVGVIAVALPLLWWRFRHTDARGADRNRLGHGGSGALRARGAALVLHLAAGGDVLAGAVPRLDRRDRRVLHLDHGDLQARRVTRDVLVDPRPACHRVSPWRRGTRCTGPTAFPSGSRRSADPQATRSQ